MSGRGYFSNEYLKSIHGEQHIYLAVITSFALNSEDNLCVYALLKMLISVIFSASVQNVQLIYVALKFLSLSSFPFQNLSFNQYI